MENNSKLYLIGGGIVLVILVFVMRKRSSSAQPTVITTTPASTDNGVAAQLQFAAQNADVFKTLAGFVFGNEAQKSQSQIALSQISASRDVGLAQTSAAT